MLPKSAINDTRAVEQILIEMHAAYSRNKIPMDRSQTEMSLSIMMAKDADIDRIYADILRYYEQASGFFKRCNIMPIKYERRLLVWLFSIYIEFGIGGLILIAYYVQWRAKQLYISNTLTLSQAVEYIFPMGVFSEEIAHEFWDKQKVQTDHPDNLIDYPIACRSFMPMQRTEPITYKDH